MGIFPQMASPIILTPKGIQTPVESQPLKISFQNLAHMITYG